MGENPGRDRKESNECTPADELKSIPIFISALLSNNQ
jgi:hypothetical protein